MNRKTKVTLVALAALALFFGVSSANANPKPQAPAKEETSVSIYGPSTVKPGESAEIKGFVGTPKGIRGNELYVKLMERTDGNWTETDRRRVSPTGSYYFVSSALYEATDFRVRVVKNGKYKSSTSKKITVKVKASPAKDSTTPGDTRKKD